MQYLIFDINVMWLLGDAITFDTRELDLEISQDKVTITMSVWELYDQLILYFLEIF